MWNYESAPEKFETHEITLNPNSTILPKHPSQRIQHAFYYTAHRTTTTQHNH